MNNNNLNPATGYWNLNYEKKIYENPQENATYCTSNYLNPLTKNQTMIDNSFAELRNNVNTFNDFMNNFSEYSSANVVVGNVSMSNICDSVNNGNVSNWTGKGNLVVNYMMNEYPSLSASGQFPTENTVCNILHNKINNDAIKINDLLKNQESTVQSLQNDQKCKGITYDQVVSQYQEMNKRRQSYDNTVNQYLSKDSSSLIQTNLKNTDDLYYMTAVWMVLGTSALYFSFRYLND